MARIRFSLSLFLFAVAAHAEEPSLYQVELIIFQNLDPTAMEAEQWPEDPGFPSLEGVIELARPDPAVVGETTGVLETSMPLEEAAAAPSPPGTAPAADTETMATPTFQWLEPQDEQLGELVKRLRGSAQFRPLLHVAWRQAIPSDDEDAHVHIYSGLEQQASNTEESPSEPMSSGTLGDIIVDQTDAQGGYIPHQPIDGIVTISRQRYLHIDTDLVFSREWPRPLESPTLLNEGAANVPMFGIPVPLAPIEQGPYIKSFRMQQTRRMRSEELHYLDHPLFGVLVSITPYTPPELDPDLEPDQGAL